MDGGKGATILSTPIGLDTLSQLSLNQQPLVRERFPILCQNTLEGNQLMCVRHSRVLVQILIFVRFQHENTKKKHTQRGEEYEMRALQI